jgi:uncharacterized protein
MTIVISEPRFIPGGTGRRPAGPVAVAAAAFTVAWACISGPVDDGHDATRLAILDSQVESVLGPTYAEFDVAMAVLRDATAAWASATTDGGDIEATRESARAAWIDAMAVWQRAELLQVGPAGSSAYVIGGEDRRDAVYSWPTVSPCRVDEETVVEGYAASDFFTQSLVNVRGLAAVEYLLWADAASNSCASAEPINQDGSWAALAADEVERRRASYAAAAAVDVAELAGELAQTWESGTGEFAVWITLPGEGGSPYATPAAGLDDLLGASSYVDTVVKDRKLAATSVADTESPWAMQSKVHVRANLEALQQLVWGGRSAGEGTGFDDLLVEFGNAELADELTRAIADAIAAVDGVDGSFEAAVTANPAALAGVQDAVQEVVDLLKGPVATTLGLSSPGEAAGDAD